MSGKAAATMVSSPGFDRLRSEGRIAWAPRERAWLGRPDDIVRALAGDGLNNRTGAVGSAVWVRQASDDRAIVFVDIDGEPLSQ